MATPVAMYHHTFQSPSVAIGLATSIADHDSTSHPVESPERFVGLTDESDRVQAILGRRTVSIDFLALVGNRQQLPGGCIVVERGHGGNWTPGEFRRRIRGWVRIGSRWRHAGHCPGPWCRRLRREPRPPARRWRGPTSDGRCRAHRERSTS